MEYAEEQGQSWDVSKHTTSLAAGLTAYQMSNIVVKGHILQGSYT